MSIIGIFLFSDDSLGYDFPFTLRAVKADGLTCAICPWSSFCRGCEIRCNNDYVLQGALPPINPMTSEFFSPFALHTRLSENVCV